MASTINSNTSSGVVVTSDTSGVLQLQTASTTAVTIDASQNVGVGTTTPDIFSRGYGKIVGVSESGNSGAALQVNSGASAYPAVELGRGGVRKFVLDAQSTKLEIASLEAVPMTFLTNSAEAMRIDSSGNLLVGTTSQSDSARFTLAYSTGVNNGMSFVGNASSAQNACIFRNTNGQVGSIVTSGSTTSYNTSSDYRLKENVQPMLGALEKVSALKPVTYTWIEDKTDGQGFIAHELQSVIPDCVTGEKDAVDADGKPVYQGIDTSFLVATLTAAIQELSAQVTELKAEVALLKGV